MKPEGGEGDLSFTTGLDPDNSEDDAGSEGEQDNISFPGDESARSKTIVLHPGSNYLRIGKASDFSPRTIPHVIARRRKTEGGVKSEERMFPRIYTSAELNMRTAQQGYKRIRGELARLGLKLVSVEEVTERNQSSKGKVSEQLSDLHWTETEKKKPQHLVGEEALYVRPNTGYNIHFPYRRGRLNVNDGPVAGTLTSNMADIAVIWREVIEKELGISQEEFCEYRVMLIIPNVFHRVHVRELVSILLETLGFSHVLLQLESVCSTFGAGVPSACVVDCGSQKTSVCCVDDGVLDLNSSVSYDYGGADISSCLFWLLHNSSFPYKKCNMSSRLDCELIDSVKQTFCHLDPSECGIHTQTLEVRTPDTHVTSFSLTLGDEPVIAPMAMFTPDILGISGAKFVHVYTPSAGESDDVFDENYLLETRRKATEAKCGGSGNKVARTDSMASFGDYEDEDDNTGFSEKTLLNERRMSTDVVLGVDQAIIQSLDTCSSEECKVKCLNCILLVGGGLAFYQGFSNWLRRKLREGLPRLYQKCDINIVTQPRGFDPREVCWKGAAILSSLDTAQELWVNREEWQKYGTRILREKMPIQW